MYRGMGRLSAPSQSDGGLVDQIIELGFERESFNASHHLLGILGTVQYTNYCTYISQPSISLRAYQTVPVGMHGTVYSHYST